MGVLDPLTPPPFPDAPACFSGNQSARCYPKWDLRFVPEIDPFCMYCLAHSRYALTLSDVIGSGSSNWFTLKQFNIYGFSFISSLALTIAGCYLVRAQTKNDLHVVKSSAGRQGET